ncbi:DUF5979 domain-containing protein [Bifidobacterium sp. ESL0790]|uniref:DUF5979 domain-containing protein n=1 Tax=Bifidobacterium sp. ESL0790 TaxID=2983233 RepID=UPI0023F95AB3|nr:DUF5979 domain-containing protein [Bifidobacterium sp. ESL0790]WEV72384.1 DUF5979 domain-containing protein [Bifidobacterium sp. ESL0790]
MSLFDNRRPMRHAAEKFENSTHGKHSAKGKGMGAAHNVTRLAAVLAAVATLLTGGIVATANSAEPSGGNDSSSSSASPKSSDNGGISQGSKPSSKATVGPQGDPEYQFLNFAQSVYGVDGANATALHPGDKFTFQFGIGCSETNCENASLTDQIPAALQGFPITDFYVSPGLQANVAWKEGGASLPGTPSAIGTNTSFTLTPGQQFVDDGVSKTGLVVGMNGTVSLTVQVPANFSPNDPRNKTDIVNPATLSADNSKPVTASATAKVSIDAMLQAQATGTFDPASTTYAPGASETLKLNVTNTSNINADKVIAQMPQDAQAPASGATSLDPNNPFRLFDFNGFGSTSMPTGATRVQVDAYVKNGSTGEYGWVTGTPSATFALPGSVSNAEVAGLRFTFTGGTMLPNAATSDPITLNLKQRSTDRNDATDAPLIELSTASTLSPVVQANAAQGSQLGTPTASAPATVTLSPAQLGVTVGETFDPARHPAGNKSTGTVVLTNGSSAVSKMDVVVGKNFFSSDIKFGGFKGAISYPSGADSGKVIYHMLDSTQPDQEVSFANGAIPAGPTGDIASFEVKFGSTPAPGGTNNPIPAGANTTIPYVIKSPSSYAFPDGQTTKDFTDSNTKATVTAHNTASNSATAPPATMTLVKPQIHVTVNKTVNPSDAVPIGHNAVVAYQETTGASTDYLQPNVITVEDSWSDKTISGLGTITAGTPGANGNDFWNSFNLNAIESTPIPAHTRLTVSVNIPGVGWIDLDTKAPQAASYLYSVNHADLASKLDTAHPGATLDQVTGIRFKLEADAGNNAFSGSTAISQYVSFTARASKRDGSGATDEIDVPDPQKPTKYKYGNTTSLAASGKTDDNDQIDTNALDVDATNESQVGVLAFHTPVIPPGEDFYQVNDWISVNYTDPADSDNATNSVPSLSNKVITSHLKWGIDSDMTSVTLKQSGDVTDYADAGAHNDKWNDVFNLVSINPIAASDTAYTNGWYLKYDKITQVRVYRASTSSWEVVAAPGGSWQNADHSFKGYTVPSADANDITGLEVHLVPDDATRTADIAAGKPFVPQPNSGIVAAGQTRDFPANWQIRDRNRVTSAFVTGSVNHSGDTDHPQPQNVRLESTRRTAADPVHHPSTVDYVALNGNKIDIVDYKAAIKEGAGNTYSLLVPPHLSSTPSSSYPSQTYDISATNDSPNRASYLRITTPSECDTSNQTGCYTANTPLAATQNPFTSAQIPDMGTGKLDSATSMPNIFNRQTLTKIEISSDDPGQVSLADSRVYILRYTPTNFATGTGTFTVDPSITTAAQANAMTESDLANVVAVSVTFQGSSDPATVGPTLIKGNYVHLKLTTRVRDTVRSTNKPFVPKAADNNTSETTRATAQIYAPITDSGVNDKPTKFVSNTINYRTGSLLASINESITPNNLVNVNPQTPQVVGLVSSSGNAGQVSTLSPTKVTLTSWPDGQGLDGSSTKTGHFWKNFDFTGLTQLTFPAGATKVQIGAYGPFGPGDAMEWKYGDEQAQLPGGSAAYTMPVASSQYNQIQGLRFIFTNPDVAGNLQLFSNSGNVAWGAQAGYQVVQRQTVRDDDTQAVTYPGSEPNAASVESESKLNDGVNPDQTTSDDTSTPMVWGFGDPGLGVSEVANNGTPSASVGQMVPWEVTIANIGNSYLNIDKVTADLPTELRFTGQGGPGDPAHPMTFTPGTVGSSPGELTTTPTLDATDPSKVVLTWPTADHKNRMLPGEVAKFVIWLEVEPGATAGSNVNLPVTVTTTQHLVSLSYAPGHVNSVDPVFDGSNTIGGKVTDFITPSSGENIYIVGGVKGSLDGAVNTLDPTQACTPTLIALDGQNYYRSPCRANTAVDGKDHWVLHMVNAGTTAVNQVQFFEQLPVKHDKSVVASGDYRGSTYHSGLTEAPQVVGAPAGTTATIEASTDSSACVGTWGTLPGISSTPANTACSASTWVAAGSVTDWSKVTGLRVTLDFTTSSDGNLKPGKGADVTYVSKNTPAPAPTPSPMADDSDPSVPVSIDQTAGVQEAWGQFGILYTSLDGSMHPSAPLRFGTRIATGSVKVGKVVTGAAASAYTPATINATVKCKTADGQAILFGGADHGTLALVKQIDGTYASARKPDIPLSVGSAPSDGTTCTVAEEGDPGQFGETERAVEVNGAATGDMTIAHSDTLDGSGNPTNAVDVSQTAKITNTYRYSGMSVTKRVDTHANQGVLGPFGFRVTCKTTDNQAVLFSGADHVDFTLNKDGVWNAPADTIPANATCIVNETDPSAADTTVFTGTNVTTNIDGTASVHVGDGSAGDLASLVATTVTNHYDAGTVTVNRTVSGAGAARYGSAPVRFHAVCDYRGQHLLDESFDISGNGSKTYGVYPAGTQCTVTQTTHAGGTTHTFKPSNGRVTIAHQPASPPSPPSTPGPDDPVITFHSGISDVALAETDGFDVAQVPIVLNRTGDESAVRSRGNGPFRIKATCTYQRDGQPTAIDLGGGDSTSFELNASNGYGTTLDDILLGARCVVEQTDSAGADSFSIDPRDGDRIVGEARPGNTITITDVFRDKPSMASTGAAVAGIVILVIVLLAGGGAIVYMRRRSTTGDDGDAGAGAAGAGGDGDGDGSVDASGASDGGESASVSPDSASASGSGSADSEGPSQQS